MRASACWMTSSVMAMNLPPFGTQRQQLFRQCRRDTVEVRRVKAVALAQLGRPTRAVQDKHRFTAFADDVHMRRSMVVGVDDSSQAIETENGWHSASVA